MLSGNASTLDMESFLVSIVEVDRRIWFLLSDVTKAFGIKGIDYETFVNLLLNDEINTALFTNRRGYESLCLCVNELGVYRLASKSKTLVAQRFRERFLKSFIAEINTLERIA